MTAKSQRIAEVAAAGCMTLLFVCLAGHAIGIDAFDESIYLGSGSYVRAVDFLTNQSWSALYGFWYAGLAYIAHDPVTRYFLSWGLLVVFASMLPALMKLPGAWIYTAIVVSLPVMLAVPYVSLFAGCILLPGMCLLTMPDRRWRLSEASTLACISCFVGGFARPELQYGVLFSAIVTVVALAIECRSAWNWRLAITKVVTVIVLTAGIQYIAARSAPANRTGWNFGPANRSAEAFVDAYNLRAGEKGLLNGQSPWISYYAQRAFGLDQNLRAYENISPIGKYFAASPRLFVGHIFDNLMDIRAASLVLLVFTLALWPWLQRDRASLRPASLYLVAVAFGVFSGILVIYPREHYAMILWPCVILYAVRLFEPQRWLALTPLCILAVAAIILCCVGVTVRRFQLAPFPSQRDHVLRVRCAQQVDRLSPAKPLAVLDSSHGLGQYAVQVRAPVYPESFHSWSAFTSWAVKTRPAWVSIGEQTPAMLGATTDELQRFLTQDMGYTAHTCPAGAGMTIFANETATAGATQ